MIEIETKTMKIKRLLLICAIFIYTITFFTNCISPSQKRIADASVIENGIIEYSINWPKSVSNNNTSLFLPKNGTLKFDKNTTRLSFSAMFGLITFEILNSIDKDSTFLLLETLGQKAYSLTSASEIFRNEFFTENKITTKIYKDSIQYIHNRKCKKASLYFNDDTFPVAHIWFATDLPTKEPYKGTFLNKIPGLILKMDGKFENYSYSINATSIYDGISVSGWNIAPPINYHYIDKNDFIENLTSVLGQ